MLGCLSFKDYSSFPSFCAALELDPENAIVKQNLKVGACYHVCSPQTFGITCTAFLSRKDKGGCFLTSPLLGVFPCAIRKGVVFFQLLENHDNREPLTATLREGPLQSL
jgi:hypothetical protein